MDMNERFLTLLTPEGEFIQVTRQEQLYELGQEIFVPIPEKKALPFVSFMQTIKGKSMVAAMAACMLAIFTFIPFYDNDVYAYMSIDVNPSIELAVNEDLQVIEIIPYNEEGEQIVAELDDWKKKDITVVTENILLGLKKHGYFEQEHQIVIGTVHTGESEKETETKLEKAMEDIEKNIASEEAEVISVEATEEDRELAIEKGVTTGKLLIEQKKIKEETHPKETLTPKTKEKIQKKSDKEAAKQQKQEVKEQKTVPNEKNENNGKGQTKKLEKANGNSNKQAKDKVKNKENPAKEEKNNKGPKDKQNGNHSDKGNKDNNKSNNNNSSKNNNKQSEKPKNNNNNKNN
jgi:hypothetical protein